MKIIDLKCPNCGSIIEITDTNKVITCSSCGSNLLVDDELQKIDSYVDRGYSLLEQKMFLKAKEVANQGLMLQPYAGRLHMVLLLAELNLTDPEDLGNYGKDYTTSANFKNCMKYLGDDDKQDLLSLVEQNKQSIPRKRNIDDVRRKYFGEPKPNEKPVDGAKHKIEYYYEQASIYVAFISIVAFVCGGLIWGIMLGLNWLIGASIVMLASSLMGVIFFAPNFKKVKNQKCPKCGKLMDPDTNVSYVAGNVEVVEKNNTEKTFVETTACCACPHCGNDWKYQKKVLIKYVDNKDKLTKYDFRTAARSKFFFGEDLETNTKFFGKHLTPKVHKRCVKVEEKYNPPVSATTDSAEEKAPKKRKKYTPVIAIVVVSVLVFLSFIPLFFIRKGYLLGSGNQPTLEEQGIYVVDMPNECIGTFYGFCESDQLFYKITLNNNGECVLTQSMGLSQVKDNIENYNYTTYKYESAKKYAAWLDKDKIDALKGVSESELLCAICRKTGLDDYGIAVIIHIDDDETHMYITTGQIVAEVDGSKETLASVMNDPRDYYGTYTYESYYIKLNSDGTAVIKDSSGVENYLFAYVTQTYAKKRFGSSKTSPTPYFVFYKSGSDQYSSYKVWPYADGKILFNGNSGQAFVCDEKTSVTYQITYMLNGGVNNSKNKTTVTGNTTLYDPTRSGYNFDGWYYDEALTVKVPTTINPTSNVVLYAKWIESDSTPTPSPTPTVISNDMYVKTIAQRAHDLGYDVDIARESSIYVIDVYSGTSATVGIVICESSSDANSYVSSHGFPYEQVFDNVVVGSSDEDMLTIGESLYNYVNADTVVSTWSVDSLISIIKNVADEQGMSDDDNDASTIMFSSSYTDYLVYYSYNRYNGDDTYTALQIVASSDDSALDEWAAVFEDELGFGGNMYKSKHYWFMSYIWS